MGNGKSVDLKNKKNNADLTKFGNKITFNRYNYDKEEPKKRLNIYTSSFDNFLEEFEESLTNDCRPIYDTYQVVNDSSIRLKQKYLQVFFKEDNTMRINVGRINTKELKHLLNFCNSSALKKDGVTLFFYIKRNETLCNWYCYNFLTKLEISHLFYCSMRQKYFFFEGLQYLPCLEQIKIDERKRVKRKPTKKTGLEITIKCAHSTPKNLPPILKLHGIHLYLLPTVKDFTIIISGVSNYWITADEQNKESMKKYLLSAIAKNLSSHCSTSLAEIKPSTVIVFDIDAE